MHPVFWWWGMCLTASFLIAAVTDAYQGLGPAFPFVPAIASTLSLSIGCAVLTGVIGVVSVPGYRTFQPFCGGERFVVAQALGISAVASATAAICGYAYVADSNAPRYGVVTAGATISSLGNVLLLHSVSLFRTTTKGAPQTEVSSPNSVLRVLAASPNRETVLTLMLVVINFGVCVGAAIGWEALVALSRWVFLPIHIVCGVVIHIVVGWIHTPQYRLFMPLAGGWRQMMASTFAWGLFTLTIYAGIALSKAAADSTLPFGHIYLCMLHAVSVSFLLVLVRTHSLQSPSGSYSMLVRDGVFVVTTAVCGHAVIVIAVFTLTMDELEHLQPPWFTTLNASGGLVMCARVGMGLLMLLPPITHLLGPVAAYPNYRLWQPFYGSRGFIALQASAWGCYGHALMASVLHFSTPAGDDRRDESALWAVVAASAAVVAQGLMHGSINLAASQPPATEGDDKNAFWISAKKSSRRIQWLPSWLTGESLTAILLLLWAQVFRIICDRLSAGDGRHRWWQQQLLLVSIVLWFPACVLAHISQHREGVPIVSPFRGSPEFVALQTLGWSATGLMFLIKAIDAAMVADIQMLHVTIGLAGIVCPVILAVSANLEAKSIARRKVAKDTLLDALDTVPDSARVAITDALGDLIGERLQPLSTPLSPSGRQLSQEEAPSPLLEEYRSHHTPVRLVVILLALATFFCFCISGISACEGYNSGSLIVASAGCIVAGFSVGFLHFGYGPLLVNTKKSKKEALTTYRYRLFMPFSGPSTFVSLQGSAWFSFSVATFLSMLLVMGYVPTPWLQAIHITTGGLFAVSQPLLYASIEYIATFTFDAPSSGGGAPKSFLELHAEGFLSISCIIGGAALGLIAELLNDGSSFDPTLPLVVSAVAACVALPFTLVALFKLAKGSPSADPGSDSDGDSIVRRTRLGILGNVILAAITIVPAMVLYGLHFAFQRQFNDVAVLIASSQRSAGLVVPPLLLFALVTGTPDSKLPQWLLSARRSFTTCTLYSVPTAVVGGAFIPVALWQSFLTIQFATTMLFYTLAHNDFLRRCIRLGNITAAVVWTLSCAYRGYRDLSFWLVFEWAGNLIGVAVALAYSRRYRSQPEVSGTLYSPLLVRFMRQYVLPDVGKYFNLRVVNASRDASKKPLESSCVLGYHPHGVFPVTPLWACHEDEWREALGSHDSSLSVHAASIIFQVPGLRDFAMGMGARVVTRASIEKTLAASKIALIVPGGQAEMVLTKYSDTEVTLCTHHVGFLKIAIRKGVPVVPMVCFGEHNIQDTIHWLPVQRWFLKRIGFGYPLLPNGRWYMPLPNQTPLTMVCGTPMAPPEDESELDSFANRYFEEVRRLFLDHRKDAGYPNLEPVLLPPYNGGASSAGKKAKKA